MTEAGRVTAYVALGANLGDAAVTLLEAATALGQLPGTNVSRRSSLYKTEALDSDAGVPGAASAPGYFNAVVELETSLQAPALLACLQRLEQQAGRVRTYRNAPRTLDLDLLLYGTATMDSAHLTVPHPRMWQRAFVLVPLAEIAPGLVSAAQLQDVSHQAIERVGVV